MKMKKNGIDLILDVKEWICTSFSWEYYIQSIDKNGFGYGLVCGLEDEIGHFYMGEVRQYVLSHAKGDLQLKKIAPAPNWKWID